MKREISTSWGLIIIFGVAVILFGGAMTYFYMTTPTTYDYETFNYPAVKKTASTDMTDGWKAYTNTNYDFTLALDDSFKGYAVREVPSTSFQTRFIRFYVPTTDTSIKDDATLGGKYENFFNVVVYTPDQWAVVQAAGDADTKDLKSASTYISKNDNYVFAYTKPSVTASDLTGKDFKLASVASSFKFVSSPTADWLLYTNLDYGFSFKYPLTLGGSKTYFDTGDATFSSITSSFDAFVRPTEWQEPFFDVAISTKTVDELIADDLTNISIAENINKTSAQVGGVLGYKVTFDYKGTGQKNNIRYYVRKGNYTFALVGGAVKGLSEPSQDVWNNIASTFQFTK